MIPNNDKEVQSPEVKKEKFYHVSVTKFIFMTVCTLGFYEVYWNYKNWKYLRDCESKKVLPLMRALFYPLFFYSLMSNIGQYDENGKLNSAPYKLFLVALLVFLSLFSIPISNSILWPISLFTFLAILPSVFEINRINKQALSENWVPQSHRPANYLVYFLGGIYVVFIFLVDVNFFPDTEVVDGDSLWSSDLSYLTRVGALAEEEEIIYFYSSGMFSIKDDGQFISKDYVTSYWADPTDDEFYLSYVSFEEIINIEIVWSEGLFEDTLVTIIAAEDQSFNLVLSPENGGDRKFIRELKRLWDQKRIYPSA